jgi:hypothetical protein
MAYGEKSLQKKKKEWNSDKPLIEWTKNGKSELFTFIPPTPDIYYWRCKFKL